jgi:hypothetical protein
MKISTRPSALLLKKRCFDVIHAQEVQRKGRSDAEQLEYACRQQRCIVRFNVKDFVLLHKLYVQNRKEQREIILLKRFPVGETLRRLLVALKYYSPSSLKNRLLFLSGEGK